MKGASQSRDDEEFEKYELVGVSQHIGYVRQRITKAAKNDLTVLIEGPTGTGKGPIAKQIYLESGRKEKPWYPVDCGSLPKDLLGSTLFGHKKGAFTGATSDKKGAIELAESGTLFLDEIGNLTFDHQGEILAFLDTGIYTPVGGTPKKGDVRIVAATNKNLLDAVQKNSFREDLYYRLAKYRIRTLPLKKRREDIVCLVNHSHAGTKLTKETAKKRYLLYACSFPGNVRQLLTLCSPHIELKEVEEEMVNCILNVGKQLGLHTEKERFEDLPMRIGAIENPAKIKHFPKILESVSGDSRRKGKFRELSFLLKILGSLKNHRNVIKSVRAYETIVLAQETCLSKEEIAETLTMRKNDLIGKNFESAFGFEYPSSKNRYYVLHPYDAYPEPYKLHGSKAPGPDFYTRFGYFPL